MRNPVVAGQFYPSEKAELRKTIIDLFTHPLGPGKVPTVSVPGARTIVGGVVPHAGYIYSGPVAAHFYSDLAHDGFPETFIIIGPNHTGVGSGVAITTEDFKTPLGVAKIDLDLAKKLQKDIIDNDFEAHRYEHSVEVQLPFLQFFEPNVKIVPMTMMMQEYDSAIRVGQILKEAIKGMDVVIIASSDFSHYVPQDIAKTKDAIAIDKIASMDLKGFYDAIYKYNITACGYGPVMAMLYALDGTPKLIKYATSGDVIKMDEVVGYSAIKVEKR